MEMKKTAAVIMAGGRGERLRPITDAMPKPLVPVGNEAAIASSAMILSRAGIMSAVSAVKYKHEDIIKTCGDVYCGVSLSYCVERENCGTAGGVREAAKLAGDYDEIVILSGDTVTDFDLSRAIACHRLRRAEATMMLTPSDEPWRYGVVGLGFDGSIISFSEKPRDAVPGALVNTGIYILSRRAVGMIPRTGEYDFGRDLFPMMLRRGEKMYGVVGKGYWCDIGTPGAYVMCCHDAALGRIAGFCADVDISGAIVGEDCRIGDGSVLTGCVLHRGVSVGGEVRAKDAVFCRGVSIGSRVTIGEGAVIGADSYIGDGVRIPSGAKIAPNSTVESGAGVFAENL